MRTEMQLPSDLALAVSWDAKKEAVHALLHGATSKDAKHIDEWLTSVQGAIRHPLTPALALIELQLKRHGRLFRDYSTKYTNAFQRIAKAVGQPVGTRSAFDSRAVILKATEELEEIIDMLQNFGDFYRLIQNFREVVIAVQKVCAELNEDAVFKTLPTISPYGTALADFLDDALRDYDDLSERSRGLSENASFLLSTVRSTHYTCTSSFAKVAHSYGPRSLRRITGLHKMQTESISRLLTRVVKSLSLRQMTALL